MVQNPTLKGAQTLTDLRQAIIARLHSSKFQSPQVGTVVKGSEEKPLRAYSNAGSQAFERSNGKSVWVLRTNCFTQSFDTIANAIKDLFATHKDVEALRNAFYQFMDDNSYTANVWSDNPNLNSILGGAPIEGKITLDEWVDKNDKTTERERLVLSSIKDLTRRTTASDAKQSLEELNELFAMVDDSVKAAPSKAGKKASATA
jgi:hypothetical protein